MLLSADIMKIPKLLPKKLTKPPSDNNEDEDEADNEKPDNADNTESQDQTETGQSENQQETVQKRADNQAILRLLGEGEKVSQVD